MARTCWRPCPAPQRIALKSSSGDLRFHQLAHLALSHAPAIDRAACSRLPSRHSLAQSDRLESGQFSAVCPWRFIARLDLLSRHRRWRPLLVAIFSSNSRSAVSAVVSRTSACAQSESLGLCADFFRDGKTRAAGRLAKAETRVATAGENAALQSLAVYYRFRATCQTRFGRSFGLFWWCTKAGSGQAPEQEVRANRQLMRLAQADGSTSPGELPCIARPTEKRAI